MATNSIQEDSIESQSNAEPAPSLTPIKPTSEEISENQMKLLILSDIGNVAEEETEEIAENQMKLLISSDIGNVAEEETPIPGENGSLHDQGSASDVEESKIEQELETDSIPTGSGSMPLEHVTAAGESSSPGVIWRENSELEAVVPSSPNSSGYVATSEGIAENQMKPLILSDIGNVAEEEPPILVENGSFHDHGSENDVETSKIERELETDSIPLCSGSMPLELVAEVGESSSPGVVWRENSELDAEVPSSPSSSGYAGERGSSSTASVGSGSGIEEAGGCTTDRTVEAGGEIRAHQDNCIDIFSDSASWIPGKRHLDEDDASISWRKRKKHFFVLSNSGKPIYSRYGDEHKLAGFSATLQAIISFVENGGDRVKFVRAGKHQVIFLVKGPIYLVCISCTEEPYEALRGQLELIYGQIILILTKSVNRCFDKNPKFDMTPLLGGTEAVFSSLIHAFSWNPATFLHAYTCLPLAYPTRQAAGSILQDVADSGVLFAILMCKHKVISLVGAQKASLHPDDMLLLSNFVLSSESFRTSESFSPICLPRYNPMAFLYAYVHYLDVDTYLMLLTTSSDAFYHLKDCRIRIEMVLLKSNVLSEVQRSMLDGGLRVEDLPGDPSLRSGFPSHLGHDRLTPAFPENSGHESSVIGGPGGLWHFIYRSIYLDQYVASEFSSPINNSNQQKRLYRAYQKLYASMHDKGAGTHKTQFRRDENYVLLCWITQDFELYAAFDPLADKALAIKICNRVCQWVRDLENEIFLLGASPFSW